MTAEKHIELSAIHNFAKKLRHPKIWPRVEQYVRWQIAMRQGTDAPLPDFAPVSINLDLTTSCNFACDHCVDMHILNQKIRFDHEKLLSSLRTMKSKGLESVIVIGGGEPTLYPQFAEVMRFMKSLGLQVSIVSNGSGNAKIATIADCFDENDWVRLSLDAGSEELFQAIHKPRKKTELEEICAWVPKIKDINPRFKFGFSFVITWKGSCINDIHIVENLHEIVLAAKRARQYRFDYIAFKPFLTRAEANNAEIVDLRKSQEHFEEIIAKIQSAIQEAQKLATPDFRVYATTNLKVLFNRSAHDYMEQPQQCHMQFFRQVLSPLGLYNCPAYRNQSHGKLGEMNAHATPEESEETRCATARSILEFAADSQCREVTCLYNNVNWWIEDMIAHPEKLENMETIDDEADFFL